MKVDAFLDFLKNEKRYSRHTVEAYACDLGQFEIFLKKFHHTELAHAKHQQIRSWMVYLMDDTKQCGPKSMNRKLSALKSFYKFLRINGKIKDNPARAIVSPKVGKKLPRTIRNEQIETLLKSDAFADDFEGIRDYLMIALFYETGIRLSELIGIELLDIQKAERVISIRGKGNKERLVHYSSDLAAKMTNYLELRQDIVKEAVSLFITKKGKPVYPRLVQRKVKAYLSTITTSSDRNPHVLRHSFATGLLDEGADINAIKHLLGHASLASTQVYTQTSIEKLKEIYLKTHPKSE